MNIHILRHLNGPTIFIKYLLSTWSRFGIYYAIVQKCSNIFSPMYYWRALCWSCASVFCDPEWNTRSWASFIISWLNSVFPVMLLIIGHIRIFKSASYTQQPIFIDKWFEPVNSKYTHFFFEFLWIAIKSPKSNACICRIATLFALLRSHPILILEKPYDYKTSFSRQ